MSDFGRLKSGRPVQRLTLQAGDLTVRLLTLGAILNDVRLAGVPYGLTLGSNNLAAYDGGPMGWFGALVGPVANRLKEARAMLDGQDLRFAPNEGTTLLHGGADGISSEIWEIAEQSADHVVFRLTLADGKGGFPGQREITARFTVTPPATLTMVLKATTDAPTLMNLANHSYWTLDGTPTITGHHLSVPAAHYIPVDAAMIPTGVAPVEGTAFDLRRGITLSPEYPQRLDHTFCLSDTDGAMKHAATLRGKSGVTLSMHSTAPGLQVFDAAPIDSGTFPGHRGTPEIGFCGVALEAQHWPDAPNQPGFPPITLRPGETYRQETRWEFERRV